VSREPIAVVGLGCRVPGASDPETFWQLLSEGGNAVGPPPDDRVELLDVSALPRHLLSRDSLRGGYLEDVDTFDAAFFRISQREARAMDPQHRLLLEVAWEALEYGAIDPLTLRKSSTGVFVGVSSTDYALLTDKTPEAITAYSAIGNALSLAANRISFAFSFGGPSMTVDAACASSLVCVHLACRSLTARECDLALAGGVSVILTPAVHASFTMARMLSPAGRCKSFDADADGYVRGEGCGIVVLKRLDDALRDEDAVLAVIRGSAVNHCGRPHGGITVPDESAQREVIHTALREAGVETREIGFVEAHGTGTPTGDPVELAAIFEVLGDAPPGSPPVAVGSVKTNIGHLEAAAGVASLIKAVLAVQRGIIPPNLNFRTFDEPSAHVAERLFIPTVATTWRADAARRIAGVSSFGFGGTNCHVVLEEPPARAPAAEEQAGPFFLTISARTPAALDELRRRYVERLDASLEVADLCYTSVHGRAQLARRVAVSGANGAALGRALRAATAGTDGRADASRAIGFVFRSHDLDAEIPGWLFAQPGAQRVLAEFQINRNGSTASDPDSLVVRRFALSCALANAWRSWGIRAHFVVSCPENDVAAAVIAGVLSPADGARLVTARARHDDAGLAKLVSSLAYAAPTTLLVLGDTNVPRGGAFDWRSYLLTSRRTQPDRSRSRSECATRAFEVARRHRPAFVVDFASGGSPLDATDGLRVVAAGTDWAATLETVATLSTAGVEVDPRALRGLTGKRAAACPTYPFQRRPLWLAPRRVERNGKGKLETPADASPLGSIRKATDEPDAWDMPIDLRHARMLADHRVAGEVIVPGVVLLEFAAGAVRLGFGAVDIVFDDVTYRHVLIVPESGSGNIRVRFRGMHGHGGAFLLLSRGFDAQRPDWLLNVEGRFAFGEASGSTAPVRERAAAWT
jgi:acyl transferase domain-containing protein